MIEPLAKELLSLADPPSVIEAVPANKIKTVESGPWKGYRVRTARKAGRCDYWHGKSSGGFCQHVIAVGEQYVEGENDPYRAGGFARDRYCFSCAGIVPARIDRIVEHPPHIETDDQAAARRELSFRDGVRKGAW